MEIIPYSDKYFGQLVAFLRENWAENHVIYDKRLFDWQYGGADGDTSGCRLLTNTDDTICGFLGTICYPFLYRDVTKKAAGLAIWVVGKEYQSSGTGLLLREAVEETHDVIYTIGINRSIVRYYQKRGYSYFESLYRYVAPLDAAGYMLYLPAQSGKPEDVRAWPETMPVTARTVTAAPAASTAPAVPVTHAASTAPAVPLKNIDADILEKAYRDGIAPYFILRPQKDAAFWQWRYLQSKGFSYLFYQDSGGIIIFREEAVHAPGDADRHGQLCLRIIEIIPADGSVWDGEYNAKLVETLVSVLIWAKERGCVLADFQISSARLGHILEAAGFRLQQDTGITNIARLFSPYRADASALNFTYKVKPDGEPVSIDRDDTYLVKSDTDMDRPNYLKN